jgi:hypothetical protein
MPCAFPNPVGYQEEEEGAFADGKNRSGVCLKMLGSSGG